MKKKIILILVLSLLLSSAAAFAEEEQTYTMGWFTFGFEGDYSEITVEENRIMARKNGGISIISMGDLAALDPAMGSEKTGEMETLIMMLDTTVPYMDDVEPFDFGEIDGAAYLITSGTLGTGDSATKIALAGVMRKNIMLLGMFENPDFSVSKEDAFAFIKNLKVNTELPKPMDPAAVLEAYSSVIEKYKTAVADGGFYRGPTYEDRITEWLYAYEHVGYALIDFDGDGLEEILIAGIDPTSSYPDDFPPMVFEIDTLVDGKPVLLFASEARVRYFLMKDNRLFRMGSSGASDMSYEMLQVHGGQLDFVEGLRSGNSSDRSGQTLYHTTDSRRSPDGREVYGNFDNPDSSVPNTGIRDFLNGIYSECYMPDLTPIA